ncbi:MAG: acyl-CoA dehydrogenase family protein [Pseudomonadota bacterium]
MPAFSTDERTLLQQSLEEFFSAQYGFDQFRAFNDPAHQQGYGTTHWRNYADLGWLGVALPESVGGMGGGTTELGIVMAAAGSALAQEPLLATIVLSASAIAKAGTVEQQQVLEGVMSGEHTLAFCHAEPDGGYSRTYIKTVAEPIDDGYRLTGDKSFALHAQGADTLVVSARLGAADGPLALFLVPSSSSGIKVRPAPGLDGRRGAAVSLDGVAIGPDARLGDASDRAGLVDELIDLGVLAVCAEAAGAMATVTDQTVEYLKTRKQFDQPLAKFQVLQHRLVDMSVAAEEARAATHGALTAYDTGDADAQTRIWRAKVQTARSARFVGGQAIQLHGGMGMTDELAIGHYYKRLSMCESLFGDGEWYLKRLAERGFAA